MKMLTSTLAVVTALAAFGVTGAANAGATLDASTEKGFMQSRASRGLAG
ncbi:amino acid ABC transporter substrate-binding protein, partial [Pseudomonas syringae]